MGMVRTQTVSDDAEIREKLERIDRRLQAQRDEVRAALAHSPQLLALAEALRETFSARLTYLRTHGFERGTDIPPGIRPSPPADAFVTRRRKKKP